MGEWIGVLLVGLIAGWLAGLLMKGQGFGLFGNIAMGIVGAAIGGILFRMVGLAATGTIGRIVSATVGAVFVLYVVALVRKTS